MHTSFPHPSPSLAPHPTFAADPIAQPQGRVLEPEVMDGTDEAQAYDAIVKMYLPVVHAGAVERALNLGPETGRFLDLGTGTGWIACQLAKLAPGITVEGIDLSESMLELAQANAQAAGVAGRVRFRRGDVKKIPLADGSVDMVLCHNMLHHLERPEALLAEVQRVLRPGGGVLIRDLIRPSNWAIPLHVHLLGAGYSPLMKKEYRDSLRAALSVEQWRALLSGPISGLALRRHFLTHASLERAHTSPRATPVSLPSDLGGSLLRKFYSA